MNHESRTVYLNTAIEALLKAEAALNELALAYVLKPGEKASACHPRTGTLSTASRKKTSPCSRKKQVMTALIRWHNVPCFAHPSSMGFKLFHF